MGVLTLKWKRWHSAGSIASIWVGFVNDNARPRISEVLRVDAPPLTRSAGHVKTKLRNKNGLSQDRVLGDETYLYITVLQPHIKSPGRSAAGGGKVCVLYVNGGLVYSAEKKKDKHSHRG